MFNNIRGTVVKKIGELANFALPFGGPNEDGDMELVGVDASRIRAHFAFEIGSDSQEMAITGASASLTFAAGAGKILRVMSTTDCFIRLDQPSGEPAATPTNDSISMYFPFGETIFLIIADTSQNAVLSAIRVSVDGQLYASIVS